MVVKIEQRDAFLVAVGHSQDAELLTSKVLLRYVLRELPKKIDMKIIKGTVVSEAKNNPGLEGYVVIDTSNITISTYENLNKIVACIHSCRDFDSKAVLDFLRDKYKCNSMGFFYSNLF